ncbi:hypothetical protein EJ02DRAFT_454413, partial [Clathrospora elynae]
MPQMRRRGRVARMYDAYPPYDLSSYSSLGGAGYVGWNGMWDPSYCGIGNAETPNSIEQATRAHVEAEKAFEKAKEKFDEVKKEFEEVKKEFEECEKKVKEAEDMLNWAKRNGGY